MGVEKFTVEVAGVFKADLKRLMRQHGFNNQHEVHQTLLRNAIAADVETAAQMLKCVTTPYVPSEKMSRQLERANRLAQRLDPGDIPSHMIK